MMVEDFTGYLKANAGVNAIAAGRIYAQNLPQKIGASAFNPLPAVVYSQIGGRRPQTMDGTGGLNDGRYQFSCQALDYKTAKQLSQAVRLALENLAGLIGTTVTLGTQLITERDTYDSVGLKFMCDIDFHIWHREP
jgi:hypothetical protein